MKQEQINSLIRTLLTLAGAFLTGGGVTYFFGHVIDTAYWEEITGTLMAAISIYWSIRTKTVDIEKLQGFVRQIVTFICGILVAKGVLNEQTSLAVLAFIAAIIPYIQAGLARKKSEQLATGEIQLHQLKMNTKVLKAIAVFMLLSCAVHAQSFFSSIPKPKTLSMLSIKKGQALTAAQADEIATVKNEFRPVTNVASYIIGNDVKESSIITGAGIGYQHVKYNPLTEKWNIVWSVNALLYGRIALSKDFNQKKLMGGVSIGAFDNLMMIGIATDGVNGYATMGVGIPLNNL